jgi:hypothetical protein
VKLEKRKAKTEKRECLNPDCRRAFCPARPWQKFCCQPCRVRGWYFAWKRIRPRRGAQGRTAASKRISTSHKTYRVASMPQALEILARRSPAFFLRLAGELSNPATQEPSNTRTEAAD